MLNKDTSDTLSSKIVGKFLGISFKLIYSILKHLKFEILSRNWMIFIEYFTQENLFPILLNQLVKISLIFNFFMPKLISNVKSYVMDEGYHQFDKSQMMEMRLR